MNFQLDDRHAWEVFCPGVAPVYGYALNAAGEQIQCDQETPRRVQLIPSAHEPTSVQIKRQYIGARHDGYVQSSSSNLETLQLTTCVFLRENGWVVTS